MGINWRIGATRVAVAVVSLGFGPTGPAEAAPLQIRAVLYNDADSPPEVVSRAEQVVTRTFARWVSRPYGWVSTSSRERRPRNRQRAWRLSPG